MRPTATPPSLVSIGCAVYNGSATLRSALDALVSQDYPHTEIIICDDASTDNSPDICMEYCARHSNITYVRNDTNIGILANYNKLFRLSTGTYFMLADQDDIRDLTFISKCVATLDADPDACLCHSHTGTFWKDFANLMHVNTIDSVDNIDDVVVRYWRFLRRYSDTALYGLMRSTALRQTALWRPDNGSCNALLFEMLLVGKFRQVPETLYYYAAKGPVRPSPAEEYRRCNGGRTMPRYYLPFLALALNQTRGILSSSCGPLRKTALLAALWTNVTATNAAKAAFRLVAALSSDHVAESFENVCARAVLDTRDIHFVVGPEEDHDYYAPHWPLRG